MARETSLMKAAHSQKGFTLIEMLVTVGVMAVVASIAVPNAVRLVSIYQLSSAANEVAFEIGRAKMQAVAQHTFVRLVFKDGGTLYRQTASSSNGSWTDATGFVRLPRNTSVSGTGPTFGNNGVASSNGVIEVRNGAGAKTVQYNILGRVTIS
jgi:prepilin-type N-terminal cleavage/methylation domain-containing protein